ncbi:MAG: hypothetical protein ACREHD_04470, partial [Pirellulales bacterium]
MSRRFQFRLRSLFWTTGIVAALCLVGVLSYEHFLRPGERQRRYFRSIAAFAPSPSGELASHFADSEQGISGAVELALSVVEKEGDKAIPLLIAMIDADNSYWTIYGVGYHSLREMTGVDYSPLHDGAWWRRWWLANRSRFAGDLANSSIPVLPKTEHGYRYRPFPDDVDTLQGKLRLAGEVLAEAKARRSGQMAERRISVRSFADEIARHYDPHAIPYLLGLTEADTATARDVANALRNLTGVAVEDHS